MCHGAIDPKTLMLEAEARYRAAQPAPDPEADRIEGRQPDPPGLMGGVPGVLARLRAALTWTARGKVASAK